jgi:hypothetical protein
MEREDLLAEAQKRGLLDAPDALDKIRATQEGLTSSIIETGEDVVSAGRRFVTDPLGITDKKASDERERTLGIERAAKDKAFQEAGLGGFRKAGQIAGTAATLAAPGSSLAKLSTGFKSAVAGEAALGGVFGAVKTQGDVEDRIEGAAKEAALFAGGGAVGKGLGTLFKGAKASAKSVQRFKEAGVKPFVSQVAASKGTSDKFKSIEQVLNSISLVGTKKASIQQFRDLSKGAVKVKEALQKEIDTIPIIKEGFESLGKQLKEAPVDTVSLGRLTRRVLNTTKEGLEKEVNRDFLKIVKGLDTSFKKPMSFTEARELRGTLDVAIGKLKKAAVVGGSTKLAVKKATKLRGLFEKAIERTADQAGRGDHYRALKLGTQRTKEAEVLKDIFTHSLERNNQQINLPKIISGFKNAEKKDLLKGMQSKDLTKLIKGIRHVASKIPGTTEPTRGLSLAGSLGTSAGVAGGAGALAGVPGAIAAAGITKGVSIALTSPLGHRLLMRAGQGGTKGAKAAMMIMRLGADEIKKATDEDITPQTHSREDLIAEARRRGIQ